MVDRALAMVYKFQESPCFKNDTPALLRAKKNMPSTTFTMVSANKKDL